jgi:hypothetical protein
MLQMRVMGSKQMWQVRLFLDRAAGQPADDEAVLRWMRK